MCRQILHDSEYVDSFSIVGWNQYLLLKSLLDLWGGFFVLVHKKYLESHKINLNLTPW